MADGGPVIQGIPGWPANLTATPTQLVNGATAGDGIGLYLFAGSNGDGLYVVGRGGGRAGVRSYSYDGDGVHGVALGPSAAAGVRGASASAAGVLGEAFAPDAPGVQGIHQAGGSDGVGVYGSARTGVWGDGAIGVIGQSQREFGIGVEGDASADGGIGVFGAATGSRGGIGVYATAPSSGSAALQVNGRAVFSSSGKLVVPAGATSATQAGVVLGPASLVLATLQENLPGIAVRAAVPDPTAGSVTVHLTQAPTADTVVGWMVVN
jgi:hypothetical protein